MDATWTINSPAGLAASAIVVFTIPCATWFFASRQELFLRLCGSRKERERMGKLLTRGKEFEKSMKLIAKFQLLLPIGMLLAALIWHLASE